MLYLHKASCLPIFLSGLLLVSWKEWFTIQDKQEKTQEVQDNHLLWKFCYKVLTTELRTSGEMQPKKTFKIATRTENLEIFAVSSLPDTEEIQ